MNTTKPHVRRAGPADATVLLNLVDQLAAYEKLPPPDAAAKERLTRDLFGSRPRIEAFLGDVGGEPAAYAIVFESYSSFLALPTLYLEDIFVLPEFRKVGLGFALFRALAEEALKRGCGRLEWMVLDWNALAIDFYKRTGAQHMKEWQLFRMTKADLERFLA